MKKKILSLVLILSLVVSFAAFASNAEEHKHHYEYGYCTVEGCSASISESADFSVPGQIGFCTPVSGKVKFPNGWSACGEQPVYLKAFATDGSEEVRPINDVVFDVVSNSASFFLDFSSYAARINSVQFVAECSDSDGNVAVFLSRYIFVSPHVNCEWENDGVNYRLVKSDCGHTTDWLPLPEVEVTTPEFAYYDMAFTFDFSVLDDVNLMNCGIDIGPSMSGWNTEANKNSDGSYTSSPAIIDSRYEGEVCSVSVLVQTELGYYYFIYVPMTLYTCVAGDADNDGVIDITDTMLVFYHVAKKDAVSWDACLRTDTNRDGFVDISDAMNIFYYVAGKIDSFDVYD